MNIENVTGFVLAGGYSSRMGSDKPFLQFGSERLIDIAVGKLKSVSNRTIIIANETNYKDLKELNYESIVDIRSGCGPLIGIYTGLLNSETEQNIFLTCDMPFIKEELLRRLIGKTFRYRTAAAALPLYGINPFPLACRRDFLADVELALQNDQLSVKALLSGSASYIEHLTDQAEINSFTNINTPDDLKGAIENL
jgi:molybdenum cofactor guanylyltransferase